MRYMNLLNFFTNLFVDNKYKAHPEAVIISCYFNPTGNPYRLKAFNAFYDTIKHTNHRIVECVIGDAKPELPVTDSISRIHTKDMLWHKETLLNNIIKTLPKEFKYVFWVDADVLFTNKRWIVDGVKALQTNYILQPFEYCVHLEKDEMKPSFELDDTTRKNAFFPEKRNPNLWRSFSSNYNFSGIAGDENYDRHGHVGFAWGARREVLDAVPLYDRALVGGADHIIAHAAAGHFHHKCIVKSFTEDIDAVMEWSYLFNSVVEGKIGHVGGDLYHIWHGDLEKRQYLKRVKEFTPMSKEIRKRDENGLYVTEDDSYVKDYMKFREDTGTTKTHTSEFTGKKKYKNTISTTNHPDFGARGRKLNEEQKKKLRRELSKHYPEANDTLIDSMIIGYLTDSTALGTVFGGNVIGALIGDMLNDNDSPMEFGGGDFSGGGAGASFDTPQTDWVAPETPSENPNENVPVWGSPYIDDNDLNENFS